jgi:hypothetical protein
MSRIVPHLIALAALAATGAAQADAVTDANQRAATFIGEARLAAPPAVRLMALVQTATYEAVLDAERAGVGAESAVVAAHRVALAQLLPAQRAAIEAAYPPAGDAGTGIGERAAQRVLAARADELPRSADTYRPHTSAGRYVPTAAPAVTLWPQRKPWLLARADQFRPGPPPALTSERWSLDYNEVKSLGGKDSKLRSAEQTEIARFWDYSLPAVYHGVVRSVALQPGRSLLANARLYAAVGQAMDDALIAVFDAKYTYNFWRPATAIRNGDIDGHDTTERDAAWTPLIDTPMHPEYPSAHSVLAASVGAVIGAEIGGAALPTLSTSSPTAGGATRRWNTLDAFVNEVGEARVLEGVHFRNSVDVGTAMGRRIGTLAAQRLLAPADVAQASPWRLDRDRPQ